MQSVLPRGVSFKALANLSARCAVRAQAVDETADVDFKSSHDGAQEMRRRANDKVYPL